MKNIEIIISKSKFLIKINRKMDEIELKYETIDELMAHWTINTTNNTCLIPHHIESYAEFKSCYLYFSSLNKLSTALEILLMLGAIFFNGLVVFCTFVGSSKKTCFDKILVGCCLVDAVTGLIDMPPYHISKE